MAKPANGRYELTGSNGLKMRMWVTTNGATVTFGEFIWDENEQAFYHPKTDIVIVCTGTGSFSAIIKAGTPDEETHSGTCVLIA